MLISIEGNIGTGKTTLMRYIKDSFKDVSKVIFIEEPVDLWIKLLSDDGENILEKFYKNKERWSYSFQMHAFITRAKELLNQPENSIIVIERSVLTDRNVFAKLLYETGCIMDIEWKLYDEWFNWLIEHFKCIKPELYIYIRADTNTSYSRMLKRCRKEEIAVDYDYINAVKKKHDDWLLNETEVPVVTLDVNNDFVENDLFRTNIIKSISDIIYSQIDNLPKSSSEQSLEDMISIMSC
jgi:deoxyadenosine/deoxycytidine kinase